tara:strand:- start:254 stop:406 length:153 start_codon:yes stop_codon:yes gene_type:complete
MKRIGDREDPIWKTFIESKNKRPDYPDVDDDGDTEESMEKALKDKDIEHN